MVPGGAWYPKNYEGTWLAQAAKSMCQLDGMVGMPFLLPIKGLKHHQLQGADVWIVKFESKNKKQKQKHLHSLKLTAKASQDRHVLPQKEFHFPIIGFSRGKLEASSDLILVPETSTFKMVVSVGTFIWEIVVSPNIH